MNVTKISIQRNHLRIIYYFNPVNFDYVNLKISLKRDIENFVFGNKIPKNIQFIHCFMSNEKIIKNTVRSSANKNCLLFQELVTEFIREAENVLEDRNNPK